MFVIVSPLKAGFTGGAITGFQARDVSISKPIAALLVGTLIEHEHQLADVCLRVSFHYYKSRNISSKLTLIPELLSFD